jgi:prolyl-tRNA synthetase
MDTATKIYDELCEAGVDTLLDDRDQRPGFKFKDADLIGIPIRITVGKRLKETGELEIKLRSKDDVYHAKPDNILAEIRKHMDSLR